GSGYMVGLEVFHQLHCLVKVYFVPAHCIDSIRLSLQCQADLTLIPFKWVSGYLEPWPDFRTTHQCKNFEKIREW
ncbi:hypothetical protein BP00DRAFT_309233, partial [Aspergillus indologenus CBS 114.80]